MLILTLLLGCDTGSGSDSGSDAEDTGTSADTLGGQEGEEFGGDDTAETTTVSTGLTASTSTFVLGPETVGCVKEDTLAITNTGEAAVSIAQTTMSAKPGEFTLTADRTFPATLDPGASVTIQLGYAPLDETVDLVQVAVYEDTAGEPVLTISGEGEGIVYDRGSETFAADGASGAYTLAAAAVGGTLSVVVDGETLAEGDWAFSAETDTVTLTTAPAAGATIDIQYVVRPPSCD